MHLAVLRLRKDTGKAHPTCAAQNDAAYVLSASFGVEMGGKERSGETILLWFLQFWVSGFGLSRYPGVTRPIPLRLKKRGISA